MSKRIHRYPIPVADYFEVTLPAGAEVLSVAATRAAGLVALDLWAAVDPDAPADRRGFHVIGTGHGLPDPLGRFIGTVQLLDGAFIGHVFEAARR